MAQVLAKRDDNWKKLQQYVLDEKQTLLVTGPGGMRIYGAQKEYRWFPREGFFVRSPTRIDGVAIGDADRRREEDRYLSKERAREKARAERRKDSPDAAGDGATPEGVGDFLRQTVEPEFVSSAYFLRFKFDEGHYALVGREKLMNRDVLRIEYYPSRLFKDADDDDDADDRRRERTKDSDNKPEKPLTEEQQKKKQERDARGDRIEQQMNKVAKATLWVDPALRQILQYQLHNIDMDFLPGRSIMRADELNASMRLGQPFPDVWLPDSLEIRAGFTLAIGRIAASYDVNYIDYRLASTDARIR
jgi:hypothetical protein